MGTVHLNGPDLGGGECVICVSQAKQRQWERYQKDIEAGLSAPADETAWIPWPADLDKQILDGRYTGVPGDAPSLGVVRGLCWDHVAGINPSGSPSSLITGGPLPRGLLKGKG